MTITVLYESWISGNRTDAIDRLEKASPSFIASFIHLMHSTGDADEAATVCRMLENRTVNAGKHAAQFGQASSPDLA